MASKPLYVIMQRSQDSDPDGWSHWIHESAYAFFMDKTSAKTYCDKINNGETVSFMDGTSRKRDVAEYDRFFIEEFSVVLD
jgi:hypothetical protein